MKCNFLKFIFVMVLALSPVRVFSDDVFMNSHWISVAESEGKPNQWICFKKNFDCRKMSPCVYLNIAVDSKYWLWINDSLVVFEGGLKRGPNPKDTYYDRVDVTRFLKKGNNSVAVLVWFWGKDGYCHKNSGRAGLLVDMKIGNSHLVSDSTWKVCIHPAYGESLPPYPNYRLPESNVHFDARKDIAGWQLSKYNIERWASATDCGTYPCEPWNKVHLRPFPNWKDSGLLKYDSIRWEKGGRALIGFLPRNISVTPYLKVKSASGKLIDIRSDNYKGGSAYNVRAEYVTISGEQSFEAYNYVNGHKIIYTIPEGVEVIEVGYRETRFNTEFVGSFVSDDKFLNLLWEKAHNTMNLNMRDAIQDPDRERSQWWGDAVIVASEIYYACDENGKKAVKKAIKNLVDWQKVNGVLYSPVPAGSWEQELPLQMLASVGKLGFWNYFMYTGDSVTIKEIYPSVKKYMSLWQLDERNLVVHRAGGWDWSDWGNDIDVQMLDNAWYSLALESLRNMALLVGDRDTADDCENRMLKVKNAVNKYYWNGNLYRSSLYNGRTDDRANALAVLAGFADLSKWKTIKNYLNYYSAASPYMEKYVLEAFLLMGDSEEGLKRMKKRYGSMVNSELTTLWEDWEIGGAGGGSINHGWAGGPLSLLPQYVLGVFPTEPGWKTFSVKPNLGILKKVECVIPVDGNEKIEVSVDKNHASLEVVCDSRRTFKVALPKEWVDFIHKRYSLNGKEFSLERLQKKGSKDISFLSEDGSYYYFDVKMKSFSFKECIE